MSELFQKRRFLFLLLMIAMASGTATYIAFHNLIYSPEPLKPLTETDEVIPPAADGGQVGDPIAAPDGGGNGGAPAAGMNGEARYFLGVSNGYVAIFYGSGAESEVTEITTIPVSRLSPGDLRDIDGGIYKSASQEELRRLLEGLGN
ncbi:MAG: hypothetical protein ACOX8W_09945 [bacterium]|jgi:hypothetical protein